MAVRASVGDAVLFRDVEADAAAVCDGVSVGPVCDSESEPSVGLIATVCVRVPRLIDVVGDELIVPSTDSEWECSSLHESVREDSGRDELGDALKVCEPVRTSDFVFVGDMLQEALGVH